MSDLSFVMKNVLADEQTTGFRDIPAWKEAENVFLSGKIPHCWAIRAPAAWHEAVMYAAARRILCDSGSGEDACGGCGGWRLQEDGRPAHPDLIVAGSFEKAANVESCRAMIRELPLKPVTAKRRLGVFPAADKLLIHAANSLLKIAEEPPSHGCILFLLEGNDFLPTLRSRSRFTVLAAPLSHAAAPLPADDEEWIARLAELKDDGDVSAALSAWASYALKDGAVEYAARTEKLRLLAEQKKLSQNMVCDLLLLTLRGGLPFEHIFGGIR